MKTCSKCGDEKPLKEFPPRTQRGKAGHQPHCRKCARKYVREHYARNRPKMYERAKKRRLSQRARFEKLKDKPCADCRNSYPPYVMDFDHRDPESKIDNLGTLWKRAAWDVVLAEVAKCDLVCSNCYRQRTHDRGSSNGRTPDFESEDVGSIPSPRATA